MGIPYRQKENPYLLVTILKDLIIYRDGIIYIKIGLILMTIKGRLVTVNFNILLLGNNKAVLKIF